MNLVPVEAAPSPQMGGDPTEAATFVISHHQHASSRRLGNLTQRDDFAMAITAVVIAAIIIIAWLAPPSFAGLG
jgi:hypothetical protein